MRMIGWVTAFILGDAYMGMTDAGIAALVAKGVLLEVCCDDAGERKAKE